MSFAQRFLLIALSTFVLAKAEAITLDWDGVTWTAGSLSNAFDIDPSKAGNDITVTVSGNTAQLQPELVAPNPMTPAITTDFQGGLATAPNTLCLAVNFTNQSQYITVTIDFSALYTAGVQNVSFTLFDIDYVNSSSSNSYQDQLRSIMATSIDGTTLVAPTITTSVANTVSGSGLTQVVNGASSANDLDPASGNGNVTISFGTAAIRSLTFTYGSGTSPLADPTYQHVGIHDISFTPVPEINPAWSAVGSCLVAAALILRHSAKFRK
ncbi:MAG TPA: hypothetical protein VM940_02865 [Chthoniobacterales bacterium]|jgi:hypothetical protein|nr:hypothetical protein [Chthoniobacterales bacterium]